MKERRVFHSFISIIHVFILWASQVALVVKNSPANAGDVGDMASISRSKRSPVFLPRESHGPRSLAGYSPVSQSVQSLSRVRLFATP